MTRGDNNMTKDIATIGSSNQVPVTSIGAAGEGLLSAHLNDAIVICSLVLGVIAVVGGAIKWAAVTSARLKMLTQRLEEMLQQLRENQPFVSDDFTDSTAGPDLQVYLTSQWRFIAKVFRYRSEKSLICKKIVRNHISDESSVLLDSGSTPDQVTAEILRTDKSARVVSNNVFAAVHLAGTNKVDFDLLPGRFDERYAAVYSPQAIEQIRNGAFTLYILASARLRIDEGIMVLKEDFNNQQFKLEVMRKFAQEKCTRLVIAVDASKFCRGLERYMPIFDDQSEWKRIVASEGKRITVVTNPIVDYRPEEIVRINQEITRIRCAGINVDDKGHQAKISGIAGVPDIYVT